MNKPPIGVAPSWYVLPGRISELAAAINRYAGHEQIMNNPEVADLIETWANEIIGHCETIKKIR